MFPMEETISNVDGLMNSMLSVLGIGDIGLAVINLVFLKVGAGHSLVRMFDLLIHLGPGFLQ